MGEDLNPLLIVDDDMFEDATKYSTNYDDLFQKFDDKCRMDQNAEWIDRPTYYGINKEL